MRLSRKVLDAYNAAIKKQGDNAENAARKALEAWFEENPDATVDEAREFAVVLMDEVGSFFGNAAGDIAYALRDMTAEAAGVELPTVDYEYSPEAEYVSKAAHYQAGKLVDGDRPGFVDGIASSSRYFSERGANDTMAALGAADGKRLGKRVRFARVPTGATNCPFCIMLASRGFVYKSELSALNANHPHCDCRIVEGFDGMEVDGYDPDLYYDRWKDSVELERYLKSEAGKAYAKASGLTREEIRDALARMNGRIIQTKGDVESFLDSLKTRKGEVGKWSPDTLHPSNVAGVARTIESMSFAQADGLKANPGYRGIEDVPRMMNCQSCVVANEARRRGYNVSARPYSKDSNVQRRLAEEPYIAFQNSKTGEFPKVVRYEGKGNPTLNRFYAVVDAEIGAGERYALRYQTREGNGHVVCIDRNDRGELRILDPQDGGVYEGKAVREYLKRVQYTESSYGISTPCDNYIFRMDDAEFNPRIVDMVLEAAE